jgi:hypothetical protein
MLTSLKMMPFHSSLPASRQPAALRPLPHGAGLIPVPERPTDRCRHCCWRHVCPHRRRCSLRHAVRRMSAFPAPRLSRLCFPAPFRSLPLQVPDHRRTDARATSAHAPRLLCPAKVPCAACTASPHDAAPRVSTPASPRRPRSLPPSTSGSSPPSNSVVGRCMHRFRVCLPPSESLSTRRRRRSLARLPRTPQTHVPLRHRRHPNVRFDARYLRETAHQNFCAGPRFNGSAF